MKILYFNNCWFTNVGEAFIDIGAMELIKKVFPNSSIACLSAMSQYYTNEIISLREGMVKKQKKIPSFFQKKSKLLVSEMERFLEADYLILAGMFATREFLGRTSRLILDYLASHGCKVIFWGLGGYEYTREEVQEFGEYLNTLNPVLIMTRDHETYENYKNITKCIDGIDCAFWVKNVFDPRGFKNNSMYDIVSFNRSKEPDEFLSWENPIIRPWHMQYSYTEFCYRENILISDTPYDYLTAYANAHHTYTDLVHATIISLMYGTPVKFWPVDKRSWAIEAVKGLKKSTDGLMAIEDRLLEKQKKEIEIVIKELLM